MRPRRGRETPVFGVLKRGEKVYTQIVKHCSIKELLPIIKGHADSDAIIYCDGCRTYDGLVNYGYKKHYRVKHDYNVFADGTNHINGIENFFGVCIKSDWLSSGVYTNTRSIYTLKSANLGTITETKTYI